MDVNQRIRDFNGNKEYKKYELATHATKASYKLSFDPEHIDENDEYLMNTDPSDYENNEVQLNDDIIALASCVMKEEDEEDEYFFEPECFYAVDTSVPECPVVLMDDSELTKVAPSLDAFLAELTLNS